MLRLRFADWWFCHCSVVGQRTYLSRTLTGERRAVLAGRRPGDRPGGERHSRGGEGGRGEDAGGCRRRRVGEAIAKRRECRGRPRGGGRESDHGAAEEDGTDQYRLRGQMSLADRRLTVAEAGARQAGPRQG